MNPELLEIATAAALALAVFFLVLYLMRRGNAGPPLVVKLDA